MKQVESIMWGNTNLSYMSLNHTWTYDQQCFSGKFCEVVGYKKIVEIIGVRCFGIWIWNMDLKYIKEIYWGPNFWHRRYVNIRYSRRSKFNWYERSFNGYIYYWGMHHAGIYHRTFIKFTWATDHTKNMDFSIRCTDRKKVRWYDSHPPHPHWSNIHSNN